MRHGSRAFGGTEGGICEPSNKCSKVIILHAGSENGLMTQTLYFKARWQLVITIMEINSEHFEEWFHDQLMPNILPN